MSPYSKYSTKTGTMLINGNKSALKKENERLFQEENHKALKENGREFEEKHLEQSVKVIQANIDKYTEQKNVMAAEIKELYDHYHSDSPEIYTELSNKTTMHDSVKLALDKNMRALAKPYFGRIDYQDLDEGSANSIYIGKHGVMRSSTEIEVVDWRAPISTVYYESQVGECSYQVPEEDEIDILLELKRTYEINQSKLVDYYDSEVVANDELLTKYLAKNKEAVLGEIIATIQKEQNDIIRQSPYHSVVVQGVAGSGKTTVAMHRISYILYNYREKFKPNEFFIIGSNRILLDYITSVLPDLDVYHVNQMTMETFIQWLLDEEGIEKKYKVITKDETITNGKTMKDINTTKESCTLLAEYKGSLAWVTVLEEYLNELEQKIIPRKPVYYKETTQSIFAEKLNAEKLNDKKLNDEKLGSEKEIVLFSEEAFDEFMKNNGNWSTQAKINMLNDRALNKIKNYFTGKDYEYDKDEQRRVIKNYLNFYGSKKWKKPLMEVYLEFLSWLKDKSNQPKLQMGLSKLILQLQDKKLDVYDLASLTYIKHRLVLTEVMEDAKHIVVDEAQDYGSMVFGVLKKVLPRCTFTIMGDVSQNINYDSGMNDWEALKTEVFSAQNDCFGILAKSYRNTIEISSYAMSILQHCTFQTYRIEPIIRHGAEVKKLIAQKESEMVEKAVSIINLWLGNGYDTIAVICRDRKSAELVQKKLSTQIEVNEGSLDKAVFSKGVMVLPIELTKGLEFDTVLLWNPNEESYPKNDANAKLLYVAATRALHELVLIHEGQLSLLL